MLALALIAVSIFMLVMRGWPVYEETSLKMAAPDVPLKYNGELTVGGKGDTHRTVDGKQHYIDHYTRTWNECRDAFYHGRDLYNEYETDESGPWLSVVPGDMFDAQRNGWMACRQQIEELRERHTDSQIRNMIISLPYWEITTMLVGFVFAGMSLAISQKRAEAGR